MTEWNDGIVTHYTVDTLHSLKDKEKPTGDGNFDGVIFSMPSNYDFSDANRLGLKLTDISNAGARDMKRTLHSADFTLTRNPEVVRELAVCQCAKCDAALDQTLATMRERPNQTIIVGTLFYVPVRSS